MSFSMPAGGAGAVSGALARERVECCCPPPAAPRRAVPGGESSVPPVGVSVSPHMYARSRAALPPRVMQPSPYALCGRRARDPRRKVTGRSKEC